MEQHNKKGPVDDHRPETTLKDTWTLHPYFCVFALAQVICLGIGIFPFAAFWLSVLLFSLSTACCFFLFWALMSLIPLLLVLAVAAAWGIGLGVVGASLLCLVRLAGKKKREAAVNGRPHKKLNEDGKYEDDKNRGEMMTPGSGEPTSELPGDVKMEEDGGLAQGEGQGQGENTEPPVPVPPVPSYSPSRLRPVVRPLFDGCGSAGGGGGGGGSISGSISSSSKDTTSRNDSCPVTPSSGMFADQSSLAVELFTPSSSRPGPPANVSWIPGPPVSDSWISLTTSSDTAREQEPGRRADESIELQEAQKTRWELE